jgi:hypothetical protein
MFIIDSKLLSRAGDGDLSPTSFMIMTIIDTMLLSRAGDGDVDHGMSEQEARLRHMLAPRPRRWIACEFFYSAIDRPWYMENPLADWLRHVGISPATKAYAQEWGLIKSFGEVKRRRLSLKFLREVSVFIHSFIPEVLKSLIIHTFIHGILQSLGAGQTGYKTVHNVINVGLKILTRC